MVSRKFRTALIALLTLVATVVVTPAASARPPYDPSLGRTPYQPDKMLVNPIAGDSIDDSNRYGFNLTEYRGLENPAYYELLDRYTVKLYRNRRGLPSDDPKVKKEEYWLKALDRFLPRMVEETNKWSGGRLRHVDYERQDYLEADHPDNEIAITFDPELRSAKGRAYPGTRLDRRGLVLTGGRVDLIHSDVWQGLFEDTNDGDRTAMYQVALVVMHELGHMLGLNHYGDRFHGEHGLMSSRRSVDDISGWGSVLARGDKAGLLAMAGWRKQARKCGEEGDCRAAWQDGGVAWPPDPPDHTYDRRPG